MFNGRIAVIRPEEIELLRRAEHHPKTEAVAIEQVKRGEGVQIVGGLFAGYSGVVLRTEEGCRVAVTIEQLSYAVVVSVQTKEVKAV
jgi:transcription antitermination factor NusG